LTKEPSWKDEARVGQQGTLTRIWAKRGTRPRIRRDWRFTWAYLFGAICPARGTGAALVMPVVSIDAMNQHLAEISKCVSVSAIALLILDGASWHSSPQLILPKNIVRAAILRPQRRSIVSSIPITTGPVGRNLSRIIVNSMRAMPRLLHRARLST